MDFHISRSSNRNYLTIIYVKEKSPQCNNSLNSTHVTCVDSKMPIEKNALMHWEFIYLLLNVNYRQENNIEFLNMATLIGKIKICKYHCKVLFWWVIMIRFCKITSARTKQPIWLCFEKYYLLLFGIIFEKQKKYLLDD